MKSYIFDAKFLQQPSCSYRIRSVYLRRIAQSSCSFCSHQCLFLLATLQLNIVHLYHSFIDTMTRRVRRPQNSPFRIEVIHISPLAHSLPFRLLRRARHLAASNIYIDKIIVTKWSNRIRRAVVLVYYMSNL